jgi:hypothetical protein
VVGGISGVTLTWIQDGSKEYEFRDVEKNGLARGNTQMDDRVG